MPIFSEYESFDALGLADLVRKKLMTPTELLDAAIERIELNNPAVNAVIHKMYDEAYAAVRKPIPDGIFQGVPFLLKDLLANYAGTPIRSGSRFTAGWISPHDSELVRRFKQAGLIIVGKTNTPEFGLSPVTEPELFGPTRNPRNLKRASGGSSGGSAAAVASGMVPAAHGGDGGGSIRIPAAYCGLFGLKPSRGRTPAGPDAMQIWQGMVVEHVLTRSVRDSAAMLDSLCGPELGSPIALPKPPLSFSEQLKKPCPKLRIAVTDQPFFSSKIHPDYQAAVKKAATLCAHLGHQVDYVTPKIDMTHVTLALMIVIAADTAAGMKVLSEMLQRKEDYHQLETATAVVCEVGNHFTAKDFAWASYILDMASKQMAEFFVNYDILLTPTVAHPAPEVGKFRPDRMEHSVLEWLRRIPYGPVLRRLTVQLANKSFALTPFAPLFNITGQPAMSVPLFADQEGMPIGIQFAGRMGEEHVLLQLASQLEQAQPW